MIKFLLKNGAHPRFDLLDNRNPFLAACQVCVYFDFDFPCKLQYLNIKIAIKSERTFGNCQIVHGDGCQSSCSIPGDHCLSASLRIYRMNLFRDLLLIAAAFELAFLFGFVVLIAEVFVHFNFRMVIWKSSSFWLRMAPRPMLIQHFMKLRWYFLYSFSFPLIFSKRWHLHFLLTLIILQNGHVHVVSFLAECGANVNCVYDGQSPLTFAFQSWKLAKTLVNAGADVNQKLPSYSQGSVLHSMCMVFFILSFVFSKLHSYFCCALTWICFQRIQFRISFYLCRLYPIWFISICMIFNLCDFLLYVSHDMLFEGRWCWCRQILDWERCKLVSS